MVIFKKYNNSIILILLWLANWVMAAEQSCSQLIEKADLDQALVVCTQAVNNNDQPAEYLNLLLQLADIHHQQGHTDTENQKLNSVRTHPNYFEHLSIQYQWNRKMGQRNLADAAYPTALKHMTTALEIAISENNKIWMGTSHNDVGLADFKLEKYQSALMSYQKSLHLKQQYGTDFQIGTTLNNLGLVYFELEQYNQAAEFYEKALKNYLSYAEKEPSDERVFSYIAHIYEDLNQAYLAYNNTDQATNYAQAITESFNLKTSANDQIRAFTNLVKWHLHNENFNLAQTFVDEALKLLNAANHSNYAWQVHLLQSKLLDKQGNTELAIEAAQLSLATGAEQNNDQITAEVLLWLGQLYHSNNDHQAAYRALQKHRTHRESFLSKKYDSDLKTIQHNIEKQQIEYDLLKTQLTNVTHQNKLQKLTMAIFTALAVLIITWAAWFIYHLKKSKEKIELLNSIEHHKQQLFLLESEQTVLENVSTQKLGIHQLKDNLKEQLVKTMIDVIHIWEVSTQSNRVELADQSKIWTISNDNGNLRTRSLDKYLSMEKIPENPRWRNVVKTCHFILAQNQVSKSQRITLKQGLDNIMKTIKSISISPLP